MIYTFTVLDLNIGACHGDGPGPQCNIGIELQHFAVHARDPLSENQRQAEYLKVHSTATSELPPEASIFGA
jgi:hypothetical protein